MKLTKWMFLLIALVLLFSIPNTNALSQTQTCPSNPTVQEIIDQVTQASVVKWIRNFSGEDEVLVAGVARRILTRFSGALFNLNVKAMAYPYLGEQLLSFGYTAGSSLTDHAYNPYQLSQIVENLPGPRTRVENSMLLDAPDIEQAASWKNKVVTIPGHGPNANQLVLLTAHLDSITYTDPNNKAPGAEDNGSGVAALMEAARLFPYYKFDRTIKIIFFTGEEQGLYGSSAYVADHSSEMPNIVGVVNLDMFGYDSNQDKCIELHVGTLSASNTVGTCFTDVNTNYHLGLSFDYLTTNGEEYSDHASFWDVGVGAIEVLENYSSLTSPNGCGAVADRNPHYHKTTDTIDKMYLPATLATAKAGIGTAASLAGAMGRCFASNPQITAAPQSNSILISWPEVSGADVYNVFRGTTTCGGTFTKVAQVTTTSYQDTDIVFDKNYFYTVQAAEADAVCYSKQSNCAVTQVPTPPPVFVQYIPLILTGE